MLCELVKNHLKILELIEEDHFKEIEMEMGVSTLPDSHFGVGTKLIMEKSESLGFKTQKMPKFIVPETCKPCGKCAFGCPRDSKWTSRKYVDEAVDFGAEVIDNTTITEIIIKNGELKGVKSKDKDFLADYVVLSAGGIETPRILNRLRHRCREKSVR